LENLIINIDVSYDISNWTCTIYYIDFDLVKKFNLFNSLLLILMFYH